MSHNIACYRGGESLADLSLPLSRRDQCPQCSAEDVTEKERPNFCDWFVPSENAFDPNRKADAVAAKAALDALFGDRNEN